KPQKLNTEFVAVVWKLLVFKARPFADDSATCPRERHDDPLAACRRYPAARSDVRSDVNTMEHHPSRKLGETIAFVLLRCIWHAIRLPLLGLLLIPAPLIRLLLGGFAAIVMLMAFVLEFTSPRPIPFIGMLAVALGAFAALALYEGLIQFLLGRRY